MSIVDKVQKMIADTTEEFVCRGPEIEMCSLALLTREHSCMLGDPGIAKTMVIERLVKRIGGVKYFPIQLFAGTTATDVFGQVSLKQLKKHDVHERNIEGHAADAHIVFADEIWQGLAGIIIGFLRMMQERQYMNGNRMIDTPLVSMFAASNFYPEDPSLIALWDRFLFRRAVNPLEEGKDIEAMLLLPDPDPNPAPALTLTELEEAQEDVLDIRIEPAAITVFMGLLMRLQYPHRDEKKGETSRAPIVVSDRRKKKCLKILKARAYMSGREAVSTCDLHALRHALWTHPDEIPVIEGILDQYRPADLSDVEGIRKKAVDACLHVLKTAKEIPAERLGGMIGKTRSRCTQAMSALNKYSTRALGDPVASAAIVAAKQEIKAKSEELSRLLDVVDVAADGTING